MNIEELKKQAETEIADFIAQKIAELNKNTGKEVSEIRFTAREKMTGLESYDVKIKIMGFCEHHPCEVMFRLLLI